MLCCVSGPCALGILALFRFITAGHFLGTKRILFLREFLTTIESIPQMFLLRRSASLRVTDITVDSEKQFNLLRM